MRVWRNARNAMTQRVNFLGRASCPPKTEARHSYLLPLHPFYFSQKPARWPALQESGLLSAAAPFRIPKAPGRDELMYISAPQDKTHSQLSRTLTSKSTPCQLLVRILRILRIPNLDILPNCLVLPMARPVIHLPVRRVWKPAIHPLLFHPCAQIY
jgi:hypothetical protein